MSCNNQASSTATKYQGKSSCLFTHTKRRNPAHQRLDLASPLRDGRTLSQLAGWALLPAAWLEKKVCETWRRLGRKVVTQLDSSASLAVWTTPSLLLQLPPAPTSRPLTSGSLGQTLFTRVCQNPSTFWWSDTHTIMISVRDEESLGSESPAATTNQPVFPAVSAARTQRYHAFPRYF